MACTQPSVLFYCYIGWFYLQRLVRATGLEPARLATYGPKPYASAIPPRPHILLSNSRVT